MREAVAQVRSDEMGREAWEQVHALRVQHHAGAGLAVVPAPDGLAVRVDLSAALPRALSDEFFQEDQRIAVTVQSLTHGSEDSDGTGGTPRG